MQRRNVRGDEIHDPRRRLTDDVGMRHRKVNRGQIKYCRLHESTPSVGKLPRKTACEGWPSQRSSTVA